MMANIFRLPVYNLTWVSLSEGGLKMSVKGYLYPLQLSVCVLVVCKDYLQIVYQDFLNTMISIFMKVLVYWIKFGIYDLLSKFILLPSLQNSTKIFPSWDCSFKIIGPWILFDNFFLLLFLSCLGVCIENN